MTVSVFKVNHVQSLQFLTPFLQFQNVHENISVTCTRADCLVVIRETETTTRCTEKLLHTHCCYYLNWNFSTVWKQNQPTPIGAPIQTSIPRNWKECIQSALTNMVYLPTVPFLSAFQVHVWQLSDSTAPSKMSPLHLSQSYWYRC